MKHIMLQAILHFLNAEVVCSVDDYQTPSFRSTLKSCFKRH